MKILLLGGYGNTGSMVAQLLLEYTATTTPDCHVVIAGRNLERAKEFCNQKLHQHADRVSYMVVDASDPISLTQAFADTKVQLVIACSSTSQHVAVIAQACLEARIDYMDVQFSAEKTEYLQSLASKCQECDVCFITDCGFHPGLPSALIRYMAMNNYQSLEAAHVGCLIRMDWNKVQTLSPETVAEFAGEIVHARMTFHKDKQWKDCTWKDFVTMKQVDFGPPFGKQPCIPMMLAEMKEITALYPTLTETGFYVSGFNWMVDWFLIPFVMLMLQIFPSMKLSMGRLLNWGLRSFSAPPFGVQLKVEITGVKNDKGQRVEESLSIRHEDGYAMTAIPLAATVLQYLSSSPSSIRKPGVYLQGTVVEPNQFLRDMKRMGVVVEESVSRDRM